MNMQVSSLVFHELYFIYLDHVVKESELTLSRDSFVQVSRVALGNHDQTLYLSVSRTGQVDVANAVNILPMKFDPS